MIFLPSKFVFGLLLLSIALVHIWDIRYNPFGEEEEEFNLQLGSWFVGGAWNSLFFLLSLLLATKEPNINKVIAIELIILNTFMYIETNLF